jgi:hypothetical protein
MLLQQLQFLLLLLLLQSLCATLTAELRQQHSPQQGGSSAEGSTGALGCTWRGATLWFGCC